MYQSETTELYRIHGRCSGGSGGFFRAEKPAAPASSWRHRRSAGGPSERSAAFGACSAVFWRRVCTRSQGDRAEHSPPFRVFRIGSAERAAADRRVRRESHLMVGPGAKPIESRDRHRGATGVIGRAGCLPRWLAPR
jgi:hypothetical protein